MQFTLIDGETGFRQCKRGFMVIMTGEHTFTQFFIPKVNRVTSQTFGKHTTVTLGKSTMKLTMPAIMWDEHGDNIIAAAMGEDAVL